MTEATKSKYRQPNELFGKVEELHADLKPYIEEGFGGWTCLKHPLVFGVPYSETMNAYYNECYKYKSDRLKEIEESVEPKWGTYIWLHERPYRIEAFSKIHERVSDEQYWEILGNIWTDTENLWQWKNIVGTLFTSKRSCREKLMTEKEAEFLAKLPDSFVVYRGHQRHNKLGFSWTLSSWRARWFARRFSANGSVSRAVVQKQDVYAVFLGRGEMEVAVHPSKLEQVVLVKPLYRPILIKCMLGEATNQFALGDNSVHGPWHWDRVERNAIAIAKETPGADMLVCRLFAVMHDCKRENDNDDPQHGHRAADFVLQKKDVLRLQPEQLDKLVEACKFHNDGQLSNDPTIGACWDADRLDLPRVDITPDPKLLSTAAAKGMIWKV